MIRPAALLLLLLTTTACAADEVGDYRLDDVLLFEAFCAGGVDAARATTFTDAMSATVPDSMLVTRGGSLSQAASQAQITRPDDSLFFTDVEGGDDLAYAGERFAEAVTVAGSRLGTDFSVLLEDGNIGCEFDVTTTVDFAFTDSGYDVATGAVRVEVAETAALSDNRCDIGSCVAEWSFAAAVSPGSSADRIDD